MRKPRDFDAELKALNDKAKPLRDRKLVQLGELTVATGADVLPSRYWQALCSLPLKRRTECCASSVRRQFFASVRTRRLVILKGDHVSFQRHLIIGCFDRFNADLRPEFQRCWSCTPDVARKR